MTSFKLKIIALVTMFIDHMGAVVPEAFGFAPVGVNLFRVIGRVSFPIFVYLIAEGFRHTKSPAKFLIRLGIFALISEIPFDMAINGNVNFFANTNIFYTLFFGGAAIESYRRTRAFLLRKMGLSATVETTPAHSQLYHNSRDFPSTKGWNERVGVILSSVVAIFPVPLFMLLAEDLTADYGALGVAFIFAMYAIKPICPRLVVMAFFCILLGSTTIEWLLIVPIAYIPPLELAILPATLIPVMLTAFYNGERGIKIKWLFYIVYPVHLFILAMI